MAKGKKFYWIKLQKEFMTGDTVDFLMGQKNGSQYVVLYQMLCIMCINTDGKLSRKIGEVIVPFDVDKIQRDCKYFSRDTVTIALELFRKLGLIYEQDSDGGLAISGFSNLVGSETDYALQKRLQRQSCGQLKDKQMDNIEDGNADSHMDSLEDNLADNYKDSSEDNCMDKPVDIVHTEKEIEIEIEKEIRDRDKESDRVITVSKDTVCQTDIRLIVEAWNELEAYGIKPISKISSSSKRYQSLVARIKEYNAADVLSAIDKIKVSDFLQGRNRQGWTITFDWFVLPNNFPKVLEGNYDNKTVPESSQESEWERKWRNA